MQTLPLVSPSLRQGRSRRRCWELKRRSAGFDRQPPGSATGGAAHDAHQTGHGMRVRYSAVRGNFRQEAIFDGPEAADGRPLDFAALECSHSLPLTSTGNIRLANLVPRL